jgi:hypothetical protein
MEIRFKVDQAESFRRGIDAPEPIVSLHIDPADLSESHRKQIGTHLFLTNIVYDPQHATEEYGEAVPIGGHPAWELVEAKEPTIASLLQALEELESNSNGHLKSSWNVSARPPAPACCQNTLPCC